MRVITWNIHRANRGSSAWRVLQELQPDLTLLQEVGSMPDEIYKVFDVLSKVAISKTGKPQKFNTVVLVRGKIVKVVPLSSEYGWVNRELDFYKGNFVSCVVKPIYHEPVNVVSVYSPAWPVNKDRLRGIDISPIKLKSNPNVWATEIIWSAIKRNIVDNEKWIVGGDYNISETFDKEWQRRTGIKTGLASSGSKEILDRMYDLGFKECLREYNGKLVPTFQNKLDKKVIHQIDHLFVTNDLYLQLQSCKVGDKSVIFGQSLSDHLTIIADFSDK